MFEDCLVESRSESVSLHQRWTTIASFSLQAVVAVILVLLPLLHPDAVLFRSDPPTVFLPKPLKPPVVHRQVASTGTSSSPALSTADVPASPSFVPIIARHIEDAPALADIGHSMGSPNAILTTLGSTSHSGPAVSVVTRPPAKPIRISTGVAQGLLLAPIRPAYPAIAKAAHVEGDVVVAAVISRTGSVEELRVLSGPAMLQSAALETIRAARYRPFLLNGEPTEVQVSITVSFRMAS